MEIPIKLQLVISWDEIYNDISLKKSTSMPTHTQMTDK